MKARRLLLAVMVVAGVLGAQAPAFANHPAGKFNYQTFPVSVSATPSLEGAAAAFAVGFDSQNNTLHKLDPANPVLPFVTWIHTETGSRWFAHASGAAVPSPVISGSPNGPSNAAAIPGSTCGTDPLTPATYCTTADYGDLVTTVGGVVDLHDFPTPGTDNCSPALAAPASGPALLNEFTLPGFWGGAVSAASFPTVAFTRLIIPSPAPVGLQAPLSDISAPIKFMSSGDTATSFPGGAPGDAATAFTGAHYDVQTALPFGLLAAALCPGTPFHAVSNFYPVGKSFAFDAKGLPDATTYADTKVVNINGAADDTSFACVNYADITDQVTLASRHTSCGTLGPSGIGDLIVNPLADPKAPGIIMKDAAGKGAAFTVVSKNTSKKQDYMTGTLRVTVSAAGPDTVLGTADDVDINVAPAKGNLKDISSTFLAKPGSATKSNWTTGSAAADPNIVAGTSYLIVACVAPAGQYKNLSANNCVTKTFTKL